MMLASESSRIDVRREPLRDLLVDQTGALPPVPVEWRRRLRRVVAATVSVCALILVAAVIARVGHASGASHASPPPKVEPAAAAQPATGSDTTSAMANAPEGKATPAEAPAAEAPKNGTLRFERPAAPGRVFIDGKRINASTASVACGQHQIKVIGYRAHALDVPCGGEVVVAH